MMALMTRRSNLDRDSHATPHVKQAGPAHFNFLQVSCQLLEVATAVYCPCKEVLHLGSVEGCSKGLWKSSQHTLGNIGCCTADISY